MVAAEVVREEPDRAVAPSPARLLTFVSEAGTGGDAGGAPGEPAPEEPDRGGEPLVLARQPDGPSDGGAARTWGISAGFLLLLGLVSAAELLIGDRSPLDLAMVALVVAVIASTLFHRRTSVLEEAGRTSEIQTFARILQALSRSVSPDALVAAIVQELGTAAGADHVVFVRLRPNTRVLDATLVTMRSDVPASAIVLPASVLDEAPLEVGAGRVGIPVGPEPPRAGDAVRRKQDGHEQQDAAQNGLEGRSRRSGGPSPAPLSPRADAAVRIAARIAGRVGALYGLRNSLAAPLRVEGSVIGAIVLSRRTSAEWSPAAGRLLEAAAQEASGSLARIYSFQDAEARAATDGLTGLPNRRAFDERCAQLAHDRRRADAIGILMIDIDHFKRLNDRHGHATGDSVLRAVASAIAAAVRQDDIPARYGGEEFVVLLRDPTWDIAIEIGERVRTAVRSLDLERLGVEQVTVSVGVAVGDTPDTAIDELLARADESLYAAKRAGRDRVIAR